MDILQENDSNNSNKKDDIHILDLDIKKCSSSQSLQDFLDELEIKSGEKIRLNFNSILNNDHSLQNINLLNGPTANEAIIVAADNGNIECMYVIGVYYKNNNDIT